MSDSQNGKAPSRATQAAHDFPPGVREELVRAWSHLAVAPFEARLVRVLQENLASMVRQRRNKLERCAPVEAGVLALELAALAELLEPLDLALARGMLAVASATTTASLGVLDEERELVEANMKPVAPAHQPLPRGFHCGRPDCSVCRVTSGMVTR